MRRAPRNTSISANISKPTETATRMPERDRISSTKAQMLIVSMNSMGSKANSTGRFVRSSHSVTDSKVSAASN